MAKSDLAPSYCLEEPSSIHSILILDYR